MHNNKLYASGIAVWHDGHEGWRAKVTFDDFGHCDRGSIHGHIATKYADELSYSVDTIKQDAEKLGIIFYSIPDFAPTVFYPGDGEWPEYLPPNNWREILRQEAKRIGFYCIY